MRELKLKELKQFAQGHSAIKWQTEFELGPVLL